MVRLFLTLALAMTVASQPLETVATSGGATMSTQFLNWAQVGFEAFLEWAKQGFGLGLNTNNENTTSEHFFLHELKLLALLPASLYFLMFLIRNLSILHNFMLFSI